MATRQPEDLILTSEGYRLQEKIQEREKELEELRKKLEEKCKEDPLTQILSRLDKIISKLDKIHTIAYNDYNDIGPGRLGGNVV